MKFIVEKGKRCSDKALAFVCDCECEFISDEYCVSHDPTENKDKCTEICPFCGNTICVDMPEVGF